MKCLGDVGVVAEGWRPGIALPAIRALAHGIQYLARLLEIAAPQKRGSLAGEAIGFVRGHSSVSDDDAGGRRRARMGAPGRLECLAVFEPMNDLERSAVVNEPRLY